MPGGALGARAPNAQGRALTWHPARGNFLVPVRALSVHFRARFLARLTRALPNVPVPPAVRQKPWVVYCKPTVQGSTLVLRYLARYVHRVAISDARIQMISADRVTFSYKDAARQHWRTMTLPGVEFLRRFLQHVLPRGFHKVRYYGLWRPSAAPLRVALQAQLRALSTPRPLAACDSIDRSPPCVRCRQCGRGSLQLVRRLPRLPGLLTAGVPP